MSYRLRISDDLYRLLEDKAAKSGVTIETLTDRYILWAMERDAETDSCQTPRPWARSHQTDEPNLRLVVS